jgi:hypothetical protein
LNFGSGNEIYTGCFSLSRLDFLGSFDPILIRFDGSGGCAAGFVCDKPDFRLTDDNMRRVCGTDGAHVPPLLELLQSCRDFVHGFLKGSVNTPSRAQQLGLQMMIELKQKIRRYKGGRHAPGVE